MELKSSVADPHHFTADPETEDSDPTTHFSPDVDPPMLQNDPLRLPPFHFAADPDPTCHSSADPDPSFQNDAELDPEHCLKVIFKKVLVEKIKLVCGSEFFKTRNSSGTCTRNIAILESQIIRSS